MMEKEIHTEIETTFIELLHLFSDFEQQDINTVPFGGSWTAGQLVRHLVKANSGFVQILNGPVKETQRKPDEKIERIKTDFLDFSKKFVSPEMIAPENVSYEKDVLSSALENIKENLILVIKSSDLTQTCLAFEVPVLGSLTRIEALSFVLYHTQRHINQLKNIYKEIYKKQMKGIK